MKPDPLACYDCGLLYSDPGWCDAVVPDEWWLQISPTGHQGGVLCLTCIARRLSALGARNVPLLITSGPWLYGEPSSGATWPTEQPDGGAGRGR